MLQVTISGTIKEMTPLMSFVAGGKAPKRGSKAMDEDEEEEPEEGEEEEEPEDGEGDEEEEEEEISTESLIETCAKKVKKNRALKAKIKALMAKVQPGCTDLTKLKKAKFAAFAAGLEKIK